MARRSRTRPTLPVPSLSITERLEDRLMLSGVSLSELGLASHDDLHTSGSCYVDWHEPSEAELFVAATSEPQAAAPFALGDTFKLHSLPGATKTIYLDFDGHTTSGTSWNGAYNGGADFTTPAYSFEGDSSFSNAELERIQRIWQRVAEDYAPFNINVTTEDPGIEALRKTGSGDTTWGIRVVIGGSASQWYGSSAGGVAYVGSFSYSTDTPAFVFEDNLGNGNEKYTAEAISHEVGHTLGLSHDGTSSVGYYNGHGSGETGWSTIMGAGYYQNVTQWSKGEYPGALNTQDDLAIITGGSNGVSYRADDHGGTNGTATVVTWAGAGLSTSGIIERNTDVDVFAIDVSAGTLSLDINPFERGPNLDILAELYNAAGTLIASSNPVSALSASFNLVVSAGRYYLHITGTGKAANGSDPGYSDYGSLGQYTVTGSFEGSSALPEVSIAVAPASRSENESGTIVYTFTRTGSTASALTVSFTVGGTATYGTDYSVTGAASYTGTTGTVTFAAGSSTATVHIDPTGDSVVELNETVLLTLVDGATYDLGATTVATGTITNDDSASLSIADVSITEGNSGTKTLVFTVTLDKAVDTGISVQYTTANGTATAGTDYTAASGTLNFTGTAGETKTISITIFGDTAVEGNETFNVVLSNLNASGRAVSFADSSATGTIINDDSAPSAPGGVAATSNRTDHVQVTWSASTGAASYEIWRNTTNSLPGAALATGIVGTTYSDSTATPGVQYYYWIRAVNGSGTSGYSLVATGAILPTVTLSGSPAAVNENSGSDLVFTFTRTGSTASALTVGFAVGGTATYGSDYTATGAASFTGSSGTVTFAAGSATAVVRLRPVGDAIVELNETVSLTLTSGAGYGLGGSNAATGTITNDDAAVLSIGDVSITEGNSGTKTLVFTVTLDKAVNTGISLNYATANGTATAGSDYTAASGTLNFVGTAGETKTISITIVGDTVIEGNETFSVALSNLNASGRSVSFAKSSATGTIVNDDSGPGTVGSLDASDNRTDYVRLTWTAVSGATSYEIWRNTTNSVPGAALVTGVTGTAYNDTTAVAGVQYYYWIRAVNASGPGSYSSSTTGNMLPIVTLGSTPAAVNENSGIDLVYTFTRTGSTAASLTVSFAVGGLATYGVDYTVTGAASYTGSSGTVTFAAGSATAVVRIRPTADSTVELSEDVVLTLSGGAGYAVGAVTTASGIIANDDTATLSISDVSISEGHSGTKTLVFTVTLDKAVDTSVSVNYATANGTATANSDYASTSGTLVFSGTAGESKTVAVTIFGDVVVEGDETFSLVLSGLAASSRPVTLARSSATGTITNDDSAAGAPSNLQATDNRSDHVQLTWTAGAGATSYEIWRNTSNVLPGSALVSGVTGTTFNDTTAVAGVQYYYWVRAVNVSGPSSFSAVDPGFVRPTVTVSAPTTITEDSGSDLVYTFTRTGSTASNLTVSFVVSGTANFGDDYTQTGAASFSTTSGTVTFAAGSSTALVRLRPTADSVVELNEVVTLSISGSAAYTIGAGGGVATGTILDDDTALFSVNDVSLEEGDSGTKTFTFQITLSRAVDVSVTVDYGTVNGTATSGVDYDAVIGRLTFAPGETSKTVTVSVNGDTAEEADETFLMALSGIVVSGRAVSYARTTATGTILDDDTQVVDPVGFVVAPNAGWGPQVLVYGPNGGAPRLRIQAYGPGFTSGVRVATGDVNGDGISDIVTAPALGVAPINVFDGQTGALLRSFYPYSQGFTGGISLAVADVTGDGRADILAGLASQGSAIRVFDGPTGNILSAYYAYSPLFLGGINIAAGDVDGDGIAEAFASPASSEGPAIRVLEAVSGRILAAYWAYDPTFRGGLHLTAGDINGDGRAEAIASPASLAGPAVRTFDALSGKILSAFYAFPPAFLGGVTIGVCDTTGDGRAEILVTPASGSQSAVRVFNALSGALLSYVVPYPASFTGGSFVAGKAPKFTPADAPVVLEAASTPWEIAAAVVDQQHERFHSTSRPSAPIGPMSTRVTKIDAEMEALLEELVDEFGIDEESQPANRPSGSPHRARPESGELEELFEDAGLLNELLV